MTPARQLLSTSMCVLAVAVMCHTDAAAWQLVNGYRGYLLGSNVASVVALGGMRVEDATVLYRRPAVIKELEWRAPYASGSEPADSVRGITFRFVDDALYQVLVKYDRDRTTGLTDEDLVELFSASYGAPAPKTPTSATRVMRTPTSLHDGIVIAQWETGDSLLTLSRGVYSPELQLALVSKPLSARALTAIEESARLDAVEAPARAVAQREKEAADASAARAKARAENRATFRP